MAQGDCLPQVQACRIRITRLDSNGVPRPGASNMVVSDAMSQLVMTPVYTDGPEIEDQNACGEVVVNLKSPDSFKRLDVTLTFLNHDPFLAEMLSGGVVLSDTPAGPKGWAFPRIGPSSTQLVSVELWAKRVRNGALDPVNPYAWWVLPQLQNLRVGAKTFANSTIPSEFSGQALENPNWFDGPLNDWPVASDSVAQWYPTATLPAPSCGYLTLAAS